jgi:hypothetical protein
MRKIHSFLPAVLCGCEIVLVLGKGYSLLLFGSMVLRKLLWREREQVTLGWRKLVIDQLHDPYSLSFGYSDRGGSEVGKKCGTCGTEEKYMAGIRWRN